MTTIDPVTLLNMTESEMLDFKSAQYKFYGRATDEEKSELLKDIIAFANAFKTSDAFIVIGVSETGAGRKDQVVGASENLKDNDIQQFVNSKTNNRVHFLVYTETVEGKTINLIKVAHVQERPIVAKHTFGKVLANQAYIRSGSSTSIATPDQIKAMAVADQQTSIAQARIELEWANLAEERRIGKVATVKCLRLIDPPPMTSAAKRIEPSVTTMDEIMQALEERHVTNYGHGFTNVHGPSPAEVLDYLRVCALLAPLHLWFKNCGRRNASSVNIKIDVPKREGLVIISKSDYPRKPKGRMLSAIGTHFPDLHLDADVLERSDAWQIRFSARTLQPQDEHWSDQIYIGSAQSQTIETVARVFADDLAKPIEVPLAIKIEVATRELTMDDIDIESEDNDD
jgi:hypothetical protein